ncbi:predicted protein, partial [Nematostella vectensis]
MICLDRTWRTIFIVGRSNNSRTNNLLGHESRVYGDILLGNFLDTYKHLSLKMLLGITWPYEHCNAKYILKTDDDCYMNIVSLILWLSEYHTQQGTDPLYIGKVQKNMAVVRTKSHRYYVSRSVHRGDFYAPYVSGGGYLFSGHLLSRLYKVSRHSRVFPVEDALLGRFMRILKVQPRHEKRFL